MGFCLSDYTDVRLRNSPFGLESRRESFCLHYSGNYLEVALTDLRAFVDAAAVIDAHVNDKSHLQPPTDKLRRQWEKEDEDAELLREYEGKDDADIDVMIHELIRVRELRAAKDGAVREGASWLLTLGDMVDDAKEARE
jgi:hypothetical protein